MKTGKKTKLSGLRKGKSNMTKSDIIDFVSSKTGQTKESTKATINAFMDTVKDTAESGGYITLSNFGVFKQNKRKGYTRKATAKQKKIFGKDTIKVPASSKLSFTASKN